MSIRILLAILLLGCCSQNAIAKPESDVQKKVEAHAQYFGFQSPEAYLHFSAELNQLMSGKKTLGEPLLKTTTYINSLGAGTTYSTLSVEQKSDLFALIKARRLKMAQSLGIPESSMDRLITQYATYSRLNAKLHNIALDKVFQTTSGEDDEIERIEVEGRLLQSWGGYDSLMMYVGITEMAMQSSISQYTPFVVRFTSRESEQTFMYNNYSGSWSISNETPCIQDSCQGYPVLNP
ncbi:hypothetical protein [Shewanella indica]|uniref:hypothetical protein n=1 Tax=Shewanella indica TaxID=768528 RepID=UPI0008F8ADA5|nr:hypothetical protein BFS86_07565 [Shewanella algae]